MEGNGWQRARELDRELAYWKGRAEGADERTQQLRHALERMIDAVAEFLRVLDEELDLDDPTSPLKAGADQVEDMLDACRTVMRGR